MTRGMFQNRQASCVHKTFRAGACHRHDRLGIGSIATIAEKGMGFRPGNIGRGCTIDVDAVRTAAGWRIARLRLDEQIWRASAYDDHPRPPKGATPARP